MAIVLSLSYKPILDVSNSPIAIVSVRKREKTSDSDSENATPNRVRSLNENKKPINQIRNMGSNLAELISVRFKATT